MNDLYFAFAQSMSDSNNITLDQAMQITEWLEAEGALDIPVLKDTYRDALPSATVFVFPMGVA